MALTDKQRDERARISREVGQRLKLARETASCTQAAIAKALGISRGRWSMYESGKRTFDVFLAFQFCDLTECDFDFVYRGDVRDANKELRRKAEVEKIPKSVPRNIGG